MDFLNRQNRFIKIEQADKDYIQKIYNTTQNDAYYPKFHIAPKHGLLNDPNGLCQIDGTHHIFYQWFPLGPVHGLKYWYHLSTIDFINYKDLGISIAPDMDYDSHGCYSGSTFIENDKAYIYYTSNKKVEDTFIQNQVIARLENNKVTKEKVIIKNHKNHKTHEFRDPIVYKKDNKYIMLVGAQNKDDEGVIEIYISENLYNFKYHKNLKFSDKNIAHMIECPNYYEEDNKGILIFSPQGLDSDENNKYDFKNVFSVVYMIGDKIDVENGEFNSRKIYELDKGFDFYAPQVYKDEQNRNIMIGWLGNSKNTYPTDKSNWAHMLTLPREIKIINNKIHQYVINEFDSLKNEKIKIDKEIKLQRKQFYLELDVDKDFELKLYNKEGENIIFKADEYEFVLDRSNMSEVYATNFGTKRYAKRNILKQTINVWADSSSIEIFCDDGQTVFTSRVFIDNLDTLSIKNIDATISYIDEINIPYKNIK